MFVYTHTHTSTIAISGLVQGAHVLIKATLRTWWYRDTDIMAFHMDFIGKNYIGKVGTDKGKGCFI